MSFGCANAGFVGFLREGGDRIELPDFFGGDDDPFCKEARKNINVFLY